MNPTWFNSSSEVLERVETFLRDNKMLLSKEIELLSSSVSGRHTPVNSFKAGFLNEFKIKNRTYRNLLFLIILYYYLEDKALRFLLRSALEEIVTSSRDSSIAELSVCLESRELLLTYIGLRVTSNDLFSNILTKRRVSSISNMIIPKFETKKKPAKKIYRRGPTDHGTMSRRSLHGEHFVWTQEEVLAYELRQIEIEREVSELRLQLLRIQLREASGF